MERTADGTIKTAAKYRDTELPSPGKEIGSRIIEAVRQVSHIEGKEGQTPLAVGIRDSNIEILVKVKKEDGSEKITLEFE